jgi:hypothetical protein
MFVCCECCVLSGRGLCDELITCPEESYWLWCVVVCDQETSKMRRPWPALDRSAKEKQNKKLKPQNAPPHISHSPRRLFRPSQVAFKWSTSPMLFTKHHGETGSTPTLHRSWGSSVGIVTRLQSGHVNIHGSIPGRGNSIQTICWAHPASYPMDTRV